MKREILIEDICTKVLSKLEEALNSTPSLLVDISELKKKAKLLVDSGISIDNAFDKLYSMMYDIAVNKLTNEMLDSDSFSFYEIENCATHSKAILENDKVPSSENDYKPVFQNNGEGELFSIDIAEKQPLKLENLKEISVGHANNVKKQKSKSVSNSINSQDEIDQNLLQVSHDICQLFPHFQVSEIHKKLCKNYGDPNYRSKVLEDCINISLKNKHDVSDEVFATLERWQNNVHESQIESLDKQRSLLIKNNIKNNSDSDFEISENKVFDVCSIADKDGQNVERCKIEFLQEIIPGLSKEKIIEIISSCSSLEEIHKIALDYLDESSSKTIVPAKIFKGKKKSKFLSPNKDFIANNNTNSNNNEAFAQSCSELIDSLQQTLSEEVAVVKNCRKNKKKCDIAGTKGDILSNYKHGSHSSFSALTEENLNAFCSNIIDDEHPDTSVETTCEIVDVVKAEPFVIELDGSVPSPCSDIFVVEEVKRSSIDSDVFIDEPVEASECLNNLTSNLNKIYKNENENNMEEAVNNIAENIESDTLPWTEAETICKLLPFLKLNDVHQSIMDNYYHPNRKAKVLMEYIDLALDGGHEVSMSTLEETLSQWQTSRKRSSSDFDDGHSIINKRQKSDNLVIPVIYPNENEAVASTSRVDVPLQDFGLPVDSNTIDLSEDIKDIYSALPEEKKSWYQAKVDFLIEITPNLSREYILSQIINCQTEPDIMGVSTRLIEEELLTTDALLVPPALPLSSQWEGTLSQAVGNAHCVEITRLENTEATTSSESQNMEDIHISPNKDEASSNPLQAADIEDQIQAHIQQLGEMFADADPDFISERANEVAGDLDKFVELVVELTGNRSYPKMEEYLKRQQKMEMRKKFIEGMSVEEFMEYFDDPEKVFCDTTKEMCKLYITNARAQLMKDLPFHLSRVIDSDFRANNYHYLPTLRELRKQKGARKTKRFVGGKQPGDLDDIFIKELCYAKMEDKIKKYNQQKEEEIKLAFEKAKEAGELKECQCCYDDEVLETNMSSCENLENLHFFCNPCIKRYSEEQIGQGKQDFFCLQGECKFQFSLNTLKRLLKPSIFSNLLKRKQAEEIAAAGIEDLESCPFCNFATIMPNKEDRVFKCLNPECLKDSCRLCKELNHIPLRCEEVEKKKQTDARTYLENEMSEAVVRECYKCKRRFIKEEGCNKMVCSCGAMMCYLCKKPIKGYDHFTSDSRTTLKPSQDKCPLWSNSLQLHAEEVQQRAAEAKQKLDPNVELLHDPTKDLPQVPDYLKKPPINIVRPLGNVPNQPGNPAYMINPANYIPHFVAEILAGNQRIQRHTHQHRHHHFYIHVGNPRNLPPPPPAHLPPPPPAHQHQPQQNNPFPPFMQAHQPPFPPMRLPYQQRPEPPQNHFNQNPQPNNPPLPGENPRNPLGHHHPPYHHPNIVNPPPQPLLPHRHIYPHLGPHQPDFNPHHPRIPRQNYPDPNHHHHHNAYNPPPPNPQNGNHNHHFQF